MHNYMKKSLIIIISSIIILILGILLVVFVKNNNQQKVTEKLPKEELYKNYDENLQESYYEVNGNYFTDVEVYGDNRAIACILFNNEREKWKLIPLSDKFLKKYENKNVLEDNTIIEMSYNDAIDELFAGLDDNDYGRRLRCEKTDGVYAVLYGLELDNYNRIE